MAWLEPRIDNTYAKAYEKYLRLRDQVDYMQCQRVRRQGLEKFNALSRLKLETFVVYADSHRIEREVAAKIQKKCAALKRVVSNSKDWRL